MYPVPRSDPSYPYRVIGFALFCFGMLIFAGVYVYYVSTGFNIQHILSVAYYFFVVGVVGFVAVLLGLLSFYMANREPEV